MVSAEKKQDEAAPITFAPAAINFYPELSSIKEESKLTTFYSRVDWMISPNMNLMWTAGYDKNSTANQIFGIAGQFTGNIEPSVLGTSESETKRSTLKLTTNISSNLIWESNLTYFDYENGIQPYSKTPGDGNLMIYSVKTPKNPIPAVNSERFIFGHDPNATQNTGIKRLQWRNDVSYIYGDHFFKGGLDIQQSEYADSLNFQPVTGPYSVRIAGLNGPEVWTNSVIADQNVLSANIAPRGFQIGNKYKQYGFYLQDDWTINSNWSVYVGMRLDKDTVFHFMKQFQGMYDQIYATSPAFIRGREVPKNRTYFSPRLQAVWKPKGDDSLSFKFGYGKFIANVVDNVTGFSRGLPSRKNGLLGTIYNRAANDHAGVTLNPSLNKVGSFKYGSVWSDCPINGHVITLPADLTPYNYRNNVGGLRDYFEKTVDSWLEAASFSTAGKSLLPESVSNS